MSGKIGDVLIELSERIYNSDIFKMPLNQEDLGNLVDSSRESISRVMAELEKDGIIKLKGKKVEIINRKSLLLISSNG